MHWWWIRRTRFLRSQLVSTLRSVFFYIGILKYMWGVSFFFQLARMNISAFVLWVCRWVRFWCRSLPSQYIAHGATIHIFFAHRQVLSFRSLIKFTQPFYNIHIEKIWIFFSSLMLFEIQATIRFSLTGWMKSDFLRWIWFRLNTI